MGASLYAKGEPPAIRGQMKRHPSGGLGQIDERGDDILHRFPPLWVKVATILLSLEGGFSRWQKVLEGVTLVKKKMSYLFIYNGFMIYLLDVIEPLVYTLCLQNWADCERVEPAIKFPPR